MKHRHINNTQWVELSKELVKILEAKVKSGNKQEAMLCGSDLDSLNMCFMADSIINRGNVDASMGYILHLAYLKGYKDATADAQEAMIKVDEVLNNANT